MLSLSIDEEEETVRGLAEASSLADVRSQLDSMDQVPIGRPPSIVNGNSHVIDFGGLVYRAPTKRLRFLAHGQRRPTGRGSAFPETMRTNFGTLRIVGDPQTRSQRG
ncbi:hypothetical protein BV898_17014 [Hypsibius exemplaris]|uniref:Uncharacterized protein n=1 Tax=Hypsibius exemplaris TaxID=2072580 RepID=A0A9X6RLL9_HYPEX|nr:hypothetical protein BV898_17014 [Hypsibius exemplaris]